MEQNTERRRYTLKVLRAMRQKTQKQVADDLGITYQTYCAWEQDLTGVAIGKVLKLADYYGVRLDEIFLRNDKNDNQVSGEQ